VGALMEGFGAWAFFGFIATMFSVISLYAAWRCTRRPSVSAEDSGAYAPLLPTASPVIAEAAADFAAEQAEAAAFEADEAAEAAGDGEDETPRAA
ncbi:MAG TPA: MFS transporter, partial [Paracoccaceae bacterium]|nr:MFS transporter [Paracoccaceae bacterium]